MNIDAKKTAIIEQFRNIKDEDLIDAIQGMLDYALKKESKYEEIPEEHKKIVRERIKKYGDNPGNYVEWDSIDNKLNTGE